VVAVVRLRHPSCAATVVSVRAARRTSRRCGRFDGDDVIVTSAVATRASPERRGPRGGRRPTAPHLRHGHRTRGAPDRPGRAAPEGDADRGGCPARRAVRSALRRRARADRPRGHRPRVAAVDAADRETTGGGRWTSRRSSMRSGPTGWPRSP
jgi:hypothetical protein